MSEQMKKEIQSPSNDCLSRITKWIEMAQLILRSEIGKLKRTSLRSKQHDCLLVVARMLIFCQAGHILEQIYDLKPDLVEDLYKQLLSDSPHCQIMCLNPLNLISSVSKAKTKLVKMGVIERCISLIRIHKLHLGPAFFLLRGVPGDFTSFLNLIITFLANFAEQFSSEMLATGAATVCCELLKTATDEDLLLHSTRLLADVAKTPKNRPLVLKEIGDISILLAFHPISNPYLKSNVALLLTLFPNINTEPIPEDVKKSSQLSFTPESNSGQIEYDLKTLTSEQRTYMQKRAESLLLAQSKKGSSITTWTADQNILPVETALTSLALESKSPSSVIKCAYPTCQTIQTDEKKFPVCGRCKMVQYCSADCQKLHWKNGHKKVCLPSNSSSSSSSTSSTTS